MRQSPTPGQGASPVRHLYDPNNTQLTIVADLLPTPLEEISVHAGPNRVRLEWPVETGTANRSFSPPTDDHRFADERQAVYHNGVLTVTVEITARKSSGSI